MLSQSDSLANSLGELTLTDTKPAVVCLCFHGLYCMLFYISVCNTFFCDIASAVTSAYTFIFVIKSFGAFRVEECLMRKKSLSILVT